MNKAQQNQIKYLLSLPYLAMLKELAHLLSAKSLPASTIFRLGAYHDCPDLVRLSRNYKGRGKANGLVGSWQAITEAGIASVYPSSTLVSVPQHLGAVKQAISQLQSSSSLEPSVGLFETLAYSIPYTLGGQLSPGELRATKQQYVQTLEYLLRVGSEEMLSFCPVWKLFPPEQFNLTDQPLLKQLYNKHLYPSISPRSSATIGWLSRFGLPCASYIRRWAQEWKARTGKSGSDSMSLPDILDLTNHTFVIVRKILGLGTLPSQNLFLDKQQYFHFISKLLKSLLARLGMDNLESNQDANHVVTQMEESAVKFITSSQDQIWKVKSDLLGKQTLVPIDQSNPQQIRRVCRLKIVRLILLFFHLLPQTHLSVQKLFNCEQGRACLLDAMGLGDTYAELIFANDLCKAKYGHSLFESSDQQLQMKKGFQVLLDSNAQQFFNRTADHDVWNRANNIEYLLSNESQILYGNRSIFSLRHSPTSMKNLSLCLANDNQFLSSMSSSAFKSAIETCLNKNLQLDVRKEEPASNYPYFPTLSVNDRMKNRKWAYIYVADRMSKQTRRSLATPSQVVDVVKSGQLADTVIKLSTISKLSQL